MGDNFSPMALRKVCWHFYYNKSERSPSSSSLSFSSTFAANLDLSTSIDSKNWNSGVYFVTLLSKEKKPLNFKVIKN